MNVTDVWNMKVLFYIYLPYSKRSLLPCFALYRSIDLLFAYYLLNAVEYTVTLFHLNNFFILIYLYKFI